MNSGKGQNPPFTKAEMDAVLRSKEGKLLLQMMQKNGAFGVSQASEALKKGDYAKAISMLKPIMDTPNTEALLQELSRKLGRP